VQIVTYDDEREVKQTVAPLDTRSLCECFEGECMVEGHLKIISWQHISVCNPTVLGGFSAFDSRVIVVVMGSRKSAYMM